MWYHLVLSTVLETPFILRTSITTFVVETPEARCSCRKTREDQVQYTLSCREVDTSGHISWLSNLHMKWFHTRPSKLTSVDDVKFSHLDVHHRH